jgi:hypothetical protein
MPIFRSYDGPDRDRDITVAMEGLLAVPREQFKALVQAKRGAPGLGFSLKPYHVPFLDSQVPNLALLPAVTLQGLLRFRQKLGFFNDEIRFLMELHHKTFSSALSVPNHAVLQTSLDEGYKRLASLATSLADDITAVVSPQVTRPN